MQTIVAMLCVQLCASLRTPPWLGRYNAGLDAKFEEEAFPTGAIAVPSAESEAATPMSSRPRSTAPQQQRQRQSRRKTRRQLAERWDSASDAALQPGLAEKQPRLLADATPVDEPPPKTRQQQTAPERAAEWLVGKYDRILRASGQP